MSAARRDRARFAVLAALLVLLAALVRWPALSTDLWLDELWSLEGFALRARSVGELLFGAAFRHDNNHPLNSLWLRLVGADASPAAYRALSLAAGLASVAVALALGRRHARPNALATGALATGALFALSFLQVVYSTEARGYAPALLCALLATLCLELSFERPRPLLTALTWASVGLGLLAHPSFLAFLLGALVWGTARVLRTVRGGRVRLAALARLHAVPLALAAAFALTILRGAARGGGPPWTGLDVADDALAWSLGYPLRCVPVWLAGGALALVALAELWRMRREGSDLWILHLVVIVLAPALALAFAGRTYLFARYFLIPLAFLLLLLGRALGRLLAAGGARAAAALLLLAAFAAGNARHLAPFYDHGRGRASAAMASILARSGPGDVVLSGAPVDVWTALPALYYAHRIDPRRTVRYVERSVAAREHVPLGWFVEQSQEPYPADPAPELRFAGARFVLLEHHPAYGPSGMHWSVYRRADEAPPGGR